MDNQEAWYMIYIGDSRRYPMLETAFQSLHISYTLWVPTEKALQKFRGKDVVKPKILMPGYVFAKFHYRPGLIEGKLPVGSFFLRRPGAVRPEPISSTFIEKIKEHEQKEQDTELMENTYNLKVGDIIEITNGPFLSATGPIRAIRGGKIYVEIDLMNRPVEVGLDPRQCTKIGENEEKTSDS